MAHSETVAEDRQVAEPSEARGARREAREHPIDG
jgi:hypothetical protein